LCTPISLVLDLLKASGITRGTELAMSIDSSLTPTLTMVPDELAAHLEVNDHTGMEHEIDASPPLGKRPFRLIELLVFRPTCKSPAIPQLTVIANSYFKPQRTPRALSHPGISRSAVSYLRKPIPEACRGLWSTIA
jgi:hypothetical protein